MDQRKPRLTPACPICTGEQGETLHHQEFHGVAVHPLERGYDVVACGSCGFVFADSTINQQAYDAYYDRMSKYADDQVDPGGVLQAWNLERLRDTAAAATQGRLTRNLGFGYANAGLRAFFRELEFPDVLGFDPPAVCVANTGALGINATQGAFGKLGLGARQFDRIVMSHVQEHLSDPQRANEEASAHLAAGGQTYVEVPDATR